MCDVFTFIRSFYYRMHPTRSVHPVFVLTLPPREIQLLWSQTAAAVRHGVNQRFAIHQGKAGQRRAYRVREHNKSSQTIKLREKEKKKRKNKTKT